jgi:hypothetical protein
VEAVPHRNPVESLTLEFKDKGFMSCTRIEYNWLIEVTDLLNQKGTSESILVYQDKLGAVI